MKEFHFRKILTDFSGGFNKDYSIVVGLCHGEMLYKVLRFCTKQKTIWTMVMHDNTMNGELI
jgi:hypothetical protein